MKFPSSVQRILLLAIGYMSGEKMEANLTLHKDTVSHYGKIVHERPSLSHIETMIVAKRGTDKDRELLYEKLISTNSVVLLLLPVDDDKNVLNIITGLGPEVVRQHILKCKSLANYVAPDGVSPTMIADAIKNQDGSYPVRKYLLHMWDFDIRKDNPC